MKKTVRWLLAASLPWLLATAACSDDEPTTAAPPASSSGPAGAASAAPTDEVLRILVSNDDGVAAPGIDALVQVLAAEPDVEVTVVAPAENQSGTGGKTTPGEVVAVETTTASGHPAVSVQGFPADAVNHGLDHVVTERPHVVVSGVNNGQNLGPFVDLSGTVGAARAAAQRGIPALAVSVGLGDQPDFDSAATLAVEWVRENRAQLLASTAASTTIDNLNVPTCTSGEIRGEVDTTADSSADPADALAAADCTSTVAAPSGDVAAFLVGFATLSTIPITPSS